MEYTIDCAGIVDRKELHRLLEETLSFPHWYGHNLDALYDCLTAISTPTHLILAHWDPPSLDFRIFEVVLNDAENNNPHFSVSFIR